MRKVLQARCPFFDQTNSVKALKEFKIQILHIICYVSHARSVSNSQWNVICITAIKKSSHGCGTNNRWKWFSLLLFCVERHYSTGGNNC